MNDIIAWLQTPFIGGLSYGLLIIIAAFSAGMIILIAVKCRKKRKSAVLTVRSGDSVTQSPVAGDVTFRSLQGQGQREEQQDAYGVCESDDINGALFVLCDGMGGMSKGGDISRSTLREIMSAFPRYTDNLREWHNCLRDINNKIFASYGGAGGTTLVMTYIEENRLWFWSIGDSDIFLQRNGLLYRMNMKHELVNKLLLQALLKGTPIKDAFSHPDKDALYEFIGNNTIEVDQTRNPFLLYPGDKLLLCSDGVSDSVSLGRLEQILNMDLDHCVREIEREITQADLPLQDNYTALIVQYEK